MKATIITIGDEILIGQIVDTNSAFIAQRLSSIGFVVESKISIGDSAEQIISTLSTAAATTDLVIVTGGLGPTKDDITKTTLAKMFDCEMRNDEEVAKHVERLLADRGVAYNEFNQAQSMVPECCEVLFNAHGTAPGMWFNCSNGSVIISLPGVPFEMKALVDDVIIDRLKDRFSLKESLHRTLITSGLAESILAERIESWELSLPEYLKLAYLPGPGRVRLRLSAYEVDSVDQIKSEIDLLFAKLEQIIPDYILGFENASVEEIIHNILIEQGLTLSVAESCTGGAIASKFTAMAGASTYFLGGVVSYSNEAKVDILGVTEESLKQYGAVSEAVAIEMAEGIRDITGSDYAISTTGIAGPTGGSIEKPVGTVWFGIATPRASFAVKKICGTERSQVIYRAVAEALAMIRKELC
ncbi:MAG: competence/damage-inducible protein A [Rikenellaceae bacterium]